MNMFMNMGPPERLIAGLVTTGADVAAWGGLLRQWLGGDVGIAWFGITCQFVGELAFTVTMTVLAILAARAGSVADGRAPAGGDPRPAGTGPGVVPGDLRERRRAAGGRPEGD